MPRTITQKSGFKGEFEIELTKEEFVNRWKRQVAEFARLSECVRDLEKIDDFEAWIIGKAERAFENVYTQQNPEAHLQHKN